MKQNSTAIATVTADVNAGRFLAHMQHLFSTSTVFLAELMQNARRAGATAIIFYVDDTVMTATDDGCGIEDFGKLVSIAESGWSQKVVESEDPFGIGFASVAFAAKEIKVESKGRMITFSHTDLVHQRQIHVGKSDFIGGTRVTLAKPKLENDKLTAAVNGFARGFPIRVFFNGKELERPHAVGHLPTVVDTPVGKVHVPGLGETEGKAALATRGFVYCQGLPIKAGDFTADRFGDSDAAPVVHVDHAVFKPRVPDRDTLIDADQAEKAITSAIKVLWRAEIEAMLPKMPPKAFVERYWSIAKPLKCQSIFNDVPALPTEALSQVMDYPIDSFEQDWIAQHPSAIDRDQVERGEIVLCSEVDTYFENDNFLRLMLARELGWVMCEYLPEGHWANAHLVNLAELPLTTEMSCLAEEEFAGRFVLATVKAIDGLTVAFDLRGNRRKAVLHDSVAISESDGDVTVLIPASCGEPSRALRQASSYRDDCDQFQETDYELDCAEFDDQVAVMRGEVPSDTLRKCLLGNAKTMSNLRGRAFVVRFDREGNPTVEEARS